MVSVRTKVALRKGVMVSVRTKVALSDRRDLVDETRDLTWHDMADLVDEMPRTPRAKLGGRRLVSFVRVKLGGMHDIGKSFSDKQLYDT